MLNRDEMRNQSFRKALNPPMSIHTQDTAIMDERILVVDDDPGTIYLLGKILNGIADMRFATNGEKALQMLDEYSPDLILLDAELPGMSGFKVFETLKKQPALKAVPVIFITSHHETGFEVSALNMGASDFIAKPFQSSLVLARVKSHLRAKRATDGLRRANAVDPLTGVSSRSQFDDSLQREWLRSLRNGDPMALMLIDVDHFKSYGERYGKAKGDTCLRRVADAVSLVVRRPADCLARFGGEQFGLLLPQTARRGAQHIARRILEGVDALALRHDTLSISQRVSVSIGLSCYDEESACWLNPTAEFRSLDRDQTHWSANHLLLAADKALHAAKRTESCHGRLLDIADIESPHLARKFMTSARESHRSGQFEETVGELSVSRR